MNDHTQNTTQIDQAGQRTRVLVVDDSQIIRASAASMLGDEFEVVLAEDGMDALAKLANFKADIIFIDIVMPRLGGYETVALLRSNAHAFKGAPIVMMSSKTGTFDVAKGRLVGCDDYIVKPFEKQDLLSAIARHARASQPAVAQ